MQIYIHRNNEQLGPFTEAEIKAQLASGALSPQDHVWWQGQQGWVPLSQSPFAAISPGSTPVAPSPLPGTPAAIETASTVQKTSQLAIWSLVCGCLTLLCGLLASIPAIILGHLALGEIKNNPSRTGRGMAISGLVIGYIMSLLNIVVITCYLMYLPQLMKMAKESHPMMTTAPQLPANSSDQTPTDTNSDQTTNAPDQSTSAPVVPPSPDQSTNSTPATTPDQSTNSAPATTNSSTPSTNSPDSSTNAAPMNP